MPAAPKPGIVPLRPLGVGELLDGALGLMRTNPKTVLGLAALISAVAAIGDVLGFWAANALIRLPEVPLEADPQAQTEFIEAGFLMLLVQLVPTLLFGLITAVASGLFMVLVGAAVLGRKLDSGQTWRMLRPRVLALAALTVLLGLAGFLTIGGMVAILAWRFLADDPAGLLLALLLMVLAAPAIIYVYVKLTLAPAVLVIESAPPWRSIGRSWRLTKGSFWRVFWITLLASIIAIVISGVFSQIALALATLAAPSSDASWPFILATGAASLLSGIVVLPFTAAVTGLIYTDMRIRREALDIELVAAGVDPTADPLAAYRRNLS